MRKQCLRKLGCRIIYTLWLKCNSQIIHNSRLMSAISNVLMLRVNSSRCLPVAKSHVSIAVLGCNVP